LQHTPQDVIFTNDCSIAHPALPHIPNATHSVFVVHDTAREYWRPAVRRQDSLDAIVAVSQVVADQFERRMASSEKLHVLHNGTLFPSDVALHPTEERKNDVLFLGGDKPFKGAYDVLNLWTVLLEKGFEGQLHWYGRVHSALQDRIRQLPQSEAIEVHGRVPRSVIFDRAAQSKVLLVPSRAEPFGMVTVEGMGMGALPVAWDIETGTQEIVTSEENGFLVPLGDHDAMAAAVLRAIRQHHDLAPNAISMAREQFSEEAMWARYADFLDWLPDRPHVERAAAGERPPPYEPPFRFFQLLPDRVREGVRSIVARSPQLSYWLRNWRGL
jgi:glycosyltransferase involved in cell wall biosynthesis